ncbi:hypothetical protein GF352_00140 [archaeon]|nr:hypothetical protein [archaeon]
MPRKRVLEASKETRVEGDYEYTVKSQQLVLDNGFICFCQLAPESVKVDGKLIFFND